MRSLACLAGLAESLGGTGGPLARLAGLEVLLATPFDKTGPDALFVRGLVLPRCQAFGVAGFLWWAENV
jgi:hypothetical protein